ncbi:hypothetical protein [Candidatus Epulonipiscium viviparus]|uniref:hypothetical protein n=1 Tax=Candidatus Epulonipiscium viviparus TaxID=420336 RepID=UPI00273809E5|nr:hypothetical protein [Candidatus Epulopiscium viviparus]
MHIQKTDNLGKDNYVVSSNKIYAVGKQDGTFKPMGHHILGEMSGIFAQPIKLSRGYEIAVDGKAAIANAYVFDDGESRFIYDKFEVAVNAADNQKVLAIEFSATEKKVAVEFKILLKIEGCWTADMVNFRDAATAVVAQNQSSVTVAHLKEEYYAKVFLAEDATIVVTQAGDAVEVKIKFELKDVFAIYISAASDADSINDNAIPDFAAQKIRRKELLKATELITDDEQFNEVFAGLKLNYDMLVQDIDGIGEGYTAGFPDFQWFFGCDTTYGIYGTLAVGQHDMTAKTLRLLKKLSWQENGNGRVIHEMSPWGVVYGKGNLQETSQFISAVYETYKWTADKVFLEEIFEFCVLGIAWIKEQAQGNSVCPKGNGIVEVAGIEGRLIDVAILTIDAYEHMEYLAEQMQRFELIEGYREDREALCAEVLDRFYNKEERFFGDIICSPHEAAASRDILVNSIKNTPTLSSAMEKYFDKVLENATGEWVALVLKNWVSILPYSKRFVPQHIKDEGLDQMLQPDFYNDYGMKISCMCNDKDDPVDDVYTLNKSMSINTGCLAEVFAANGQIDKAYELLKCLAESMYVDMPAAISEILPDDGCFMQFWSGYGIHHVFMKYIVGLTADAPNRSITIEPNLPVALNEIAIKNLQVGDCIIDITIKRKNGAVTVAVNKNSADYNIVVRC